MNEKRLNPSASKHKIRPIQALNQAGICELFRVFVKTTWKFQRQATEHFGIGDDYLSKILAGERAPNTKMLESIGYQRERLFTPTRADCFKLPDVNTNTCFLWDKLEPQVTDVVKELESKGINVIGYYCEKNKQAIISVMPSHETTALGGQLMHSSLTQDKTIYKAHYIAHFMGCLVRWSEIKEAKDGFALMDLG